MVQSMKDKSTYTYIRITKEQALKLRKLGTKGETYEQILDRILTQYTKQ